MVYKKQKRSIEKGRQDLKQATANTKRSKWKDFKDEVNSDPEALATELSCVGLGLARLTRIWMHVHEIIVDPLFLTDPVNAYVPRPVITG